MMKAINENMKKYEFIEHTADIGVRAYGKNLSEAFENVAVGMFDIISDTSKIDRTGEYRIDLEADNIEQLLVDWLSELLYIHETKNVLLSGFNIELDKNKLRARVYGEELDKRKHPIKNEIKAVTYHILEVNEKKGYVQVLFDI